MTLTAASILRVVSMAGTHIECAVAELDFSERKALNRGLLELQSAGHAISSDWTFDAKDVAEKFTVNHYKTCKACQV